MKSQSDYLKIKSRLLAKNLLLDDFFGSAIDESTKKAISKMINVNVLVIGSLPIKQDNHK